MLESLTAGQAAVLAVSIVLATVVGLAWWGDRKSRHASHTRA